MGKLALHPYVRKHGHAQTHGCRYSGQCPVNKASLVTHHMAAVPHSQPLSEGPATNWFLSLREIGFRVARDLEGLRGTLLTTLPAPGGISVMAQASPLYLGL